MFGLSILSLIVAATVGVQTWALYAMIGPTAIKIVAFIVTYLVLRAMVSRRLGRGAGGIARDILPLTGLPHTDYSLADGANVRDL